MNSDLLDAALAYAAQDYAIFPTHGIRDGQCTCGDPKCQSPGKHPRIKEWQAKATSDLATITIWWTNWPDANIGFPTGNGIGVLDEDTKNDGPQSLERLQMQHGRVPDGPVCRTGSNGRHFYLSDPEGAVKCGVGFMGSEYPGLDFRGPGGYVLLPPSNHVSGGTYSWEVDSELGQCEIPAVPPWLKPSRATAKGKNSASANPAEPIPEGQRNGTLTSLAGALRAKGLSQQGIEAALLAENATRCSPPLDEAEVRTIAQSIARYPAGTPASSRDVQPMSGGLPEALEAIEAFLRRYLVLPRDGDFVAITLWVAHTHYIEQADTSPYLAITSAEKRCGKSRVLDTVELLVARPWQCIGPTEAVMFRKIDQDCPTMLLDEVDTIFGPNAKEHEGLRSLLNAGNRRGTTVPRTVGKNFAIKDFNVFCPKVLAGIGKLPTTVADRSIPIRIKRRKKSEKVDKLRRQRALRLAQPIHALLEDLSKSITLPLEADVPHALNDRAADGWEPLLAIADHAGPIWGKRARAAAILLSGDVDDDDSLGVKLLSDIRDVFPAGQSRMPSAELVTALRELPESPWADFGKSGLTQNSLARQLGAFEIKTKDAKLDSTKVWKTYERADFDEPFERYLAVSATSEAQTATPLPEGLLNEAEKPGGSGVADPPVSVALHGTSSDQNMEVLRL